MTNAPVSPLGFLARHSWRFPFDLGTHVDLKENDVTNQPKLRVLQIAGFAVPD